MPKATPRRKARSEMPAREVGSGVGCVVGGKEEAMEEREGGGNVRGGLVLLLLSALMSTLVSVSASLEA